MIDHLFPLRAHFVPLFFWSRGTRGSGELAQSSGFDEGL